MKNSPWEEYKNKNKKARPWDIFNNNIEEVDDHIQKDRLSICRECPEFIKKTSQCKKCGCFMKIKTKLPHSNCPLGKWSEIL